MNQFDQKVVTRYCHLIFEMLNLKRVLKERMNWRLVRTDFDSMTIVIQLKPNNPSVLELVTHAVFNNPEYDLDEVGENFHYSRQAEVQYKRQVMIAEKNDAEVTCTMCGQKILLQEWRYPIYNDAIFCEDCYLQFKSREGESAETFDDEYDDDDDR